MFFLICYLSKQQRAKTEKGMTNGTGDYKYHTSNKNGTIAVSESN